MENQIVIYLLITLLLLPLLLTPSSGTYDTIPFSSPFRREFFMERRKKYVVAVDSVDSTRIARMYLHDDLCSATGGGGEGPYTTVNLYITLETEMKGQFICVVGDAIINVVSDVSSPYGDFSELIGKIGVVQDEGVVSSLHKLLQRGPAGLRPIYYNNSDSLIDAYVRGEVDYVYDVGLHPSPVVERASKGRPSKLVGFSGLNNGDIFIYNDMERQFYDRNQEFIKHLQQEEYRYIKYTTRNIPLLKLRYVLSSVDKVDSEKVERTLDRVSKGLGRTKNEITYSPLAIIASRGS
jgi:hypothetical protein